MLKVIQIELSSMEHMDDDPIEEEKKLVVLYF